MIPFRLFLVVYYYLMRFEGGGASGNEQFALKNIKTAMYFTQTEQRTSAVRRGASAQGVNLSICAILFTKMPGKTCSAFFVSSTNFLPYDKSLLQCKKFGGLFLVLMLH